MQITEAKRITGGLSNPSKMPGAAYSLPALKSCPSGREYAKETGTICSFCYATRNRYCFSNVRTALDRRMDSLTHPDWMEAMETLIARTDKFFRWHDSGDIMSVQHLDMLLKLAQKLPDHKFWLPTHEMGFINKWIEDNGRLPDNVTVRLSAVWPRQIPLEDKDLPEGVVRSAVDLGSCYEGDKCRVYVCPVGTNGRKTCGNCRACWSRKVPVVSYHKH